MKTRVNERLVLIGAGVAIGLALGGVGWVSRCGQAVTESDYDVAAGPAGVSAVTEASGDEEAGGTIRFAPRAYTAQCEYLQTGAKWRVTYDGHDTSGSVLVDAGEQLGGGASNRLVRGARSEAWYPERGFLQIADVRAPLPAMFMRELGVDGTDPRSRLEAFVPPHVFTSSEINGLIDSGEIELLGKSEYKGMATVTLGLTRTLGGEYMRVWLTETSGVRVKAERDDKHLGTVAWACDVESWQADEDLLTTIDLPADVDVRSVALAPIGGQSDIVQVTVREPVGSEMRETTCAVRVLEPDGSLVVVTGPAGHAWPFRMFERLKNESVGSLEASDVDVGSTEYTVLTGRIAGIDVASWSDSESDWVSFVFDLEGRGRARRAALDVLVK